VRLSASVEQVYDRFSGYPCPPSVSVCEQCGPEWSAEDIFAAPLRALTFSQLTAVHVMSLDDDALRHFFPRLMDLSVSMPSPVFDFRISDLKDRLTQWLPDEVSAVRHLAEALWSELSDRYPLGRGYFSDCVSAIDLLDWCGMSVVEHLEGLRSATSSAAALHIADLVDAVFTHSVRFESDSRTTVLEWVSDDATGRRLEEAFFAADSQEVADQLASAHELWVVCR
jgi:hypothetical protein